jgi:hypothetical protein
VFEITHIEFDVSNRSVGVLDEPARDEVVQIIRNRAKGDCLISGRFVNLPNLRKGETERCLRLCIGAREL